MRGSFAFGAAAALAVVSCASASASDPSASDQSGQAIETADTAKASATVITPFGKTSAACVHAATTSDTEIDESRATASCATPVKPDTDAEPAGWVAWADEDLAAGVSFLQADFTVPPVPKDVGDQVIFIFPSLTPTINPPIIQPVLQFGEAADGGGKYWSMASWYLNKAANSWNSTVVKVAAGDVLRGTIQGTGTCAKGQCTSWTITTADLTQPSLTTTLTVKGTGTHYVQIQGAALETYQMDSCAQYPATTVAFTNILLKDNSGAAITPKWNLFENKTATPSCGFGATSSAPNAIDLTYSSTL